MKAVILCGGLGTRLRQVISDVPKPMADIAGTPFLALLMQELARQGADGFVLCVSHLREKIKDYFGDNFMGIPVEYSVEEEPLGTGGALRKAFIETGLADAIALNGDSYVAMDYADFYRRHSKEELAIALKWLDDTSRSGIVEVDGGRVVKFNEKRENSPAGFINAGVYAINENLWKRVPDMNKFSFEKDVLEPLAPELKPLYAKTEDYFIDIGIPESYAQGVRELKGKIAPNKALFLDRDGTINVDAGHTHKISDLRFVDGIFDLAREAKAKDYKLIVITNQAGIAKGIYDEAQYHAFMSAVAAEFERQGAALDDAFFCPYHKDGLGRYKRESFDRKPLPGMLFKAAIKHRLDLSKCIMLGDTESDVEAGMNARVGRTLRLCLDTATPSKATTVIKHLNEAGRAL
jgi:D,D-heptose 1,7-bisphosphate phosphatase